ncbi:MAG: ergothioneine biosynthesis protein EgtB [Pseudomonadota bacterium]
MDWTDAMAPLDEPVVGDLNGANQLGRNRPSPAANAPAADAPLISMAGLQSVSALTEAFIKVRADSETLAAPLSPEDWMLQSMEAASPVKWNLAHTTWFFETFILKKYKDGYEPFDARYGFLFNSYYNQIGAMYARPHRGMLSRPTADEVLAYRAHVADAVIALAQNADASLSERLAPLLALGCAHEEQHQELLLTDIKHALHQNPFAVAAYPEPETWGEAVAQPPDPLQHVSWTAFEGGLATIGVEGEGFAFDSEGPAHQVFLKPFALCDRLITNADYLEFMDDGGYDNPQWWLSDGWARVQAEDWCAPLYWRGSETGWRTYTLHGETPMPLNAPVTHLSFYEAAAFAEWTGYRLPTEVEWEVAARAHLEEHGAAALHRGFLNPKQPSPPASIETSARSETGVKQLFGDVWEWTASPYIAYPGYRAAPGAIGEYNGKFMSSQMVLRGGSCATPRGHVRPTYRNFFPPHARWQFSGLRLARDL